MDELETLAFRFFLLMTLLCIGIAVVCIRKTKDKPRKPMATRPSRLARWLTQRRNARDNGWRRGWDHIRG